MSPTESSERTFHEAFRKRLVAVRVSLDWSQAQMAAALGVPLANYKKYEIRSKFPPHLLERLALVTHRNLDFWIAGRNVRTAPRRLVG